MGDGGQTENYNGEKRAQARRRARATASRRECAPTKDDLEATAIEYARWLANRDGIDISKANNKRVEYGYLGQGLRRERRAVAVIFFHGKARLVWNSKRRRYDEYTDVIDIARIEIPNWDFVPVALELPDDFSDIC